MTNRPGAVTAAEPGTPETPLSRESVIGSARWSLIAMVIQQVGRLAFSIYLARLIGPESFGIVAQATIYVSLTALFLDQGLGASLIQKRQLGELDAGTVLWLNSTVAAGLAVLTILLAPLVADFFRTPELTLVLRVLSVTVFLKGLSVVPASLLARTLRFRALAFTDSLAVVIGGVCGVVVGVARGDYWALVVQLVVTDLLRTGVLFTVADRIRLRFSASALRSMWGYSWRIMSAQTFQFWNRNLDNLLVGRFLGAVDLALYNMAYRVLLLPLQLVGQVANRVAFPTFARLQSDSVALRAHFFAATRLMAFLGFPFMTLVLVAAPTAVPVVFGEAWASAALPMQILALTGMRQTVQTVAGPLLMSVGRAREVMHASLLNFVFVTVAVVVGLQWGIVGVALGYSIGDLLVFPILLRLLERAIGVSPRDYLAALVPACIGSGAMALAWVVVAAASTGRSEGLQLVLAGSAAVATYVLAMAHLSPRDVRLTTSLLGLRRQGSLTNGALI